MGKWQRANYQPCLPLGDNQSRITGSDKHIQLSRAAAVEGSVLLKNMGEVLPFAKGTKVAIFGKAQIDYVKGGGGSGNTQVEYVRNIYEGLKMKSQQVEVFDALSLYYQNYVNLQYKEGAKLGMFEEAPIPEDLLAQAKDFTDTAIITICRFSSEGYDRHYDGTDTYFYLSEAEQLMVNAVTENFAKVVVLLNVGALMDTSWFSYNDNISSVLLLWQGGMEGGLAAADLLVGDVTPSGKLVDTCAKSIEDYPSTEGFHESEDYVKYTEDIFVGYRYFETIPGKKDLVTYPFGYGLSYTTFALTNSFAWCDEETIWVTLNVTNTGVYAGKEVVQVYYSAPTGKLDKPAIELCGFTKTRLLKPGETQKVMISFAIKDMASYDDMGKVNIASYVLEKGVYRIWVGTSVRDLIELDYHYVSEENVITEQLTTYCTPTKLDKRMKADGTYESVSKVTTRKYDFPCTYKLAEKPDVSEPYILLDVAEGRVDLDTFIAQMSDEELCNMVAGQPNTGIATTGGMGNLKRLRIPNVMTTDGPAGVRVWPTREVNTTAFPVATALACTWDLELMEEIGRAGALEVKENNLSIWLTPALNIHRNPLCGRNFEYFSEDPFLSGKMAIAKIKGIHSQQIVATPKHLACNNKETNRFYSDSIVSERALREIYLKGFEMCVKETQPKMIMTCYNLVNGLGVSENAEILSGIVREEWGFRGMFTTDWWNKRSHITEIKAGNDIKMPESNVNLYEELQQGNVTREEIALCVKHILEMILWLD